VYVVFPAGFARAITPMPKAGVRVAKVLPTSGYKSHLYILLFGLKVNK